MADNKETPQQEPVKYEWTSVVGDTELLKKVKSIWGEKNDGPVPWEVRNFLGDSLSPNASGGHFFMPPAEEVTDETARTAFSQLVEALNQAPEFKKQVKNAETLVKLWLARVKKSPEAAFRDAGARLDMESNTVVQYFADRERGAPVKAAKELVKAAEEVKAKQPQQQQQPEPQKQHVSPVVVPSASASPGQKRLAPVEDPLADVFEPQKAARKEVHSILDDVIEGTEVVSAPTTKRPVDAAYKDPNEDDDDDAEGDVYDRATTRPKSTDGSIIYSFARTACSGREVNFDEALLAGM